MAPPGPSTHRGRVVRRAAAALAAILVVATAVALVVRAGSGSDLPPVRLPKGATDGTRVDRYDLDSTAADRSLVQTVGRPAGDVRGRPLLVLLHGKSQDPAVLAGGPLRAALRALGDRAPVVLLPADDGGSYWHDRRSGAWARYVTTEAIPAVVRRYGLDPDRTAIGGFSMGGAGAFALAPDSPGRFCAVGGHSAALWTDRTAAAPGAYDDAEDFAANDPVSPALARTGRRYGVPLALDAGADDPFLRADRAFAAALRARGEDVRFTTGPGAHELHYWERGMSSYLRFYATTLGRCGT